MIQRVASPLPLKVAEMHVILNWIEELKRLVE